MQQGTHSVLASKHFEFHEIALGIHAHSPSYWLTSAHLAALCGTIAGMLLTQPLRTKTPGNEPDGREGQPHLE